VKLAGRTATLLLAATAIGAAVFQLVNTATPVRRQDLPPGESSRYALHLRREEGASLVGVLPFTLIVAEIGGIALVARNLGVSLNGRPRRKHRKEPSLPG